MFTPTPGAHVRLLPGARMLRGNRSDAVGAAGANAVYVGRLGASVLAEVVIQRGRAVIELRNVTSESESELRAAWGDR